MTNAELIKALRCKSNDINNCTMCAYHNACYGGTLEEIAAAALEADEKRIAVVEEERDLERFAAKNYLDKIDELKAQLPKEGEFIYEDLDNFRKYKVTCPHCGAWYIGNYDAYDEPSDFNYCPHCGNICNPANLAWEKELSERERKEQNDADN